MVAVMASSDELHCSCKEFLGVPAGELVRMAVLYFFFVSCGFAPGHRVFAVRTKNAPSHKKKGLKVDIN